jgi:hypothetical protein
MKIRYEAPPHHSFKLDDEREVYGGDTIEVTDEEAEELLTSPIYPFSDPGNEVLAEEREAELKKKTRPALNQEARKAGVKDPESLENKDAVIAAIKKAEADKGAEPDAGEGDDNNEED